MKTINGHIQVYNVWVNGRDMFDKNQHFPIDSNVEREWHTDFKLASSDFLNAVANEESEHGMYCEIFKDYHVCLYSIDINVKDFENMFDLNFDLNDDRVQEMIPYYVDYNLNVVAERIAKFKNK